MDIHEIVVRPLLTEKSTQLAQRKVAGAGGRYCFEVHRDANKAEIRDAIEKLYKVKVLKVRTQVREGKAHRFRFFYGSKSHSKKAVVTLDVNSHIDLF